MGVDQSQYFDEKGLKSPFYRVSLKAIVRDDEGRMLVTREPDGVYELPGGGWDHDENAVSGLTRELEEELGIKVTRVGDARFVYKGWSDRPHMLLRVAVEVEVASHDFVFNEDEVSEAHFVDREEFLQLNWNAPERSILEHVDRLWPSATAAGAVDSSTPDNDKISL